MQEYSTKIYDEMAYKKKKKEVLKIVEQINKYYEQYSKEYSKNDNFIKEKSMHIKETIIHLMDNGMEEEDALKKVLPEAYALVKLACREVLGKTYYDVQLMSGIVLNDGYVSEMKTGEGKTITAALPVYLNALLGKGAHVITPNVYLAARDYEYMAPLYEKLGLSCGLVEEQDSFNRNIIIHNKARIIYDEVVAKGNYTAEQKKLIEKKALEAAYKSYQENSIRAKQEEYKCDVTYGSAHAFAFDYLYDLLENNPENIRMRLGNPNFLVIDEADQVLFDDAITSYNISGDQKDTIFAIPNSEKKDHQRAIMKATFALNYLMDNPDYLKEYPDSYHYHENLDDYQSSFTRHTPVLSYCKKSREYNLNYVGTNLLYRFFYFKEINKIFEDNKDRILSMKYQGKRLFVPGQNYDPKTNKFNIDPHTLSVLVRSNKIEELSALYDKFMLEDYADAYQDISNVIYAWLFLEKDVDYKYTLPDRCRNQETDRKISILINGRVASGRVYSNGLQQAVEAKEKALIRKNRSNINIVDTEINDILASIPVASFFGRYAKFSGMTGTSAREAFRDLYGVDTFTVPRNRPYMVKDRGDVLYRTTEEKNKAILEELIISHKAGQPVLLTTTSVGESKKLYDYLIPRLKARGIYIDIPVLNANVESLRREARIIANAGKKGAVTIATDMAGRGTDIKLGGENATQKEHDEITSLGGLKIIGSGHFKYQRSDNQVKGRTGRQGDVGEIIFFNDLDDLRRLNMNPKLIETFNTILDRGPIREKPSNRTLLQKAIKECQDKTEAQTKEAIFQSQKTDGPIAVCRNQFHNIMEEIKTTNNYEDAVKDMITVVVQDIYKASSKTTPNTEDINRKRKISREQLDTNMFNKLSEEFLGIRIKEEVFDSFETNGELLDFLQKVLEKKLKKSKVSKELVDSYFQRIWLHFQDIEELIKRQYILAGMIPGGTPTDKIDPCIYEGFKYSYHSMYAQIVRDILHPNRNKEKDHFGVFEINIQTDAKVEFLTHQEYEHYLDREEELELRKNRK